MGNIFISYSHKDSKYVNKLEQDLIANGFEVWIDGKFVMARNFQKKFKPIWINAERL